MHFANLSQRLRQALMEDGAFSDATTKMLRHHASKKTKAKVMCKAQGIFCGSLLLLPIFRQLDRSASVKIHKKDGQAVKPGQALAVVSASSHALLAGERLFLNLATHLSGIATLTRRYVQAVKGTSAVILETRKTLPLWRELEKYAVVCGGGTNHRFSLSDAILVKDNHWKIIKSSRSGLGDFYGARSLKGSKRKMKFVEVEATSYAEVWEAIKARVDIILLDNMPLNQLKGSIEFIKASRAALNSDRPLIEVSGGITIEKAREAALLGVDRISVGALTHSAPALDLSLEVD